ncbi:hypothetical protein D9M68_924470 [compost metagenome]
MTPPPSPVNEPNNPAKKAPIKTIRVKINTVMVANISDFIWLNEIKKRLNKVYIHNRISILRITY